MFLILFLMDFLTVLQVQQITEPMPVVLVRFMNSIAVQFHIDCQEQTSEILWLFIFYKTT